MKSPPQISMLEKSNSDDFLCLRSFSLRVKNGINQTHIDSTNYGPLTPAVAPTPRSRPSPATGILGAGAGWGCISGDVDRASPGASHQFPSRVPPRAPKRIEERHSIQSWPAGGCSGRNTREVAGGGGVNSALLDPGAPTGEPSSFDGEE